MSSRPDRHHANSSQTRFKNMSQFLRYIYNTCRSMSYFSEINRHRVMILVTTKGSASKHKIQKTLTYFSSRNTKQKNNLISNRIFRYLEINSHTDDHQLGLRTGGSTHTGSADLYETLGSKQHVKTPTHT